MLKQLAYFLHVNFGNDHRPSLQLSNRRGLKTSRYNQVHEQTQIIIVRQNIFWQSKPFPNKTRSRGRAAETSTEASGRGQMAVLCNYVRVGDEIIVIGNWKHRVSTQKGPCCSTTNCYNFVFGNHNADRKLSSGAYLKTAISSRLFGIYLGNHLGSNKKHILTFEMFVRWYMFRFTDFALILTTHNTQVSSKIDIDNVTGDNYYNLFLLQ